MVYIVTRIIIKKFKIMSEMMTKYHELYKKMAMATDVKAMHVFGDATTEMMDWMVVNKPDMAKDILAKLESIEWKQYLSAKEAQTIYSKIVPAPKWDYATLTNALTAEGLATEEMPYFNSYALWIVISALYSDIGDVLAWAMGKEPASVDPKAFLTYLYKMALKYLKDADGVYDVRKYFSEYISTQK